MSIPIVNQENYAFIIGLLIEQKSTVQLAVKILKPLTKKKDIEETALRFDSDGSIESDDNDTIR